jgi:hypothetical protein
VVFVANTAGGASTADGIRETLTNILSYRKIAAPCAVQHVFSEVSIPIEYTRRAIAAVEDNFEVPPFFVPHRFFLLTRFARPFGTLHGSNNDARKLVSSCVCTLELMGVAYIWVRHSVSCPRTFGIVQSIPRGGGGTPFPFRSFLFSLGVHQGHPYYRAAVFSNCLVVFCILFSRMHIYPSGIKCVVLRQAPESPPHFFPALQWHAM